MNDDGKTGNTPNDLDHGKNHDCSKNDSKPEVTQDDDETTADDDTDTDDADTDDDDRKPSLPNVQIQKNNDNKILLHTTVMKNLKGTKPSTALRLPIMGTKFPTMKLSLLTNQEKSKSTKNGGTKSTKNEVSAEKEMSKNSRKAKSKSTTNGRTKSTKNEETLLKEMPKNTRKAKSKSTTNDGTKSTMPKILRKTPRKQSIKVPARKANTTTKKTPPKALPKAKLDEEEVNVAAIMKRVVSMQEYRSDHNRTLKDDKEFGTKNAHDMDPVFHKRKFEKYVQQRFKEDNWFSNK